MGEKMRKIELLCPASSLEVLKIAVIYGADAVYIGGEAFGLRARPRISQWRRWQRELPLRMLTV